jgi:hypothetical protein
MKSLKEKIKLMQAFDEGEFIEEVPIGGNKWCVELEPRWNWEEFDYRIKYELMEFWVTVYDSGTIACWTTKEEADENLSSINSRTIKVREVTDE